MWGKIAIVAFGLLGLYLAFRLPKEHCVCGFTIPEGGGMCECGDYNGRMVTQEVIDVKIMDERREHNFSTVREKELKRIEEEKRKGNDYDTFL